MATKKAAAAQAAPVNTGYIPSLRTKYKEEIVGNLMKEFSYTTVMQVPKLVKITLNEGVGQATQDKKMVEVAQEELTAITGQKAVQTVSRKDISNFKLRRGMPIGAKVTLRGNIDIDKIVKVMGMEITFVTTAKTDQEAYALLREFGLPFKNIKK